MKSYKAITLFLGVAIWIGGFSAADTLFFKDGQTIDCIVHDEKKIWKDIEDPNFYEIEISSGFVGFWDEGQIDRIEKNDNFVRPSDETQAMMRKLIEEKRLILPQAMVEGNVLFPTDMGKSFSGQVTQLKNYGFLKTGGLTEKLQIKEGQEFRTDQILSTAANSRLKFSVGPSLSGGLLGASELSIIRLNKIEHISTDEMDFSLNKGKMFLSVHPFEIGTGVKERLKIQINDCEIRPEDSLIYIDISPEEQFRLTLIRGEALSVRVKGTPSGAQILAGETLLVPLRGEKKLDKENAPEDLEPLWVGWDDWSPKQFQTQTQIMTSKPQSAPMLGELSAVSGNFGNQNTLLGAPLITDSLPAILKRYREALERYKAIKGNYPDPAQEGLKVLLTEIEKEGSIDLEKLPLIDPWGYPLVYELIDSKIEEKPVYASIRSVGPNGMDEKGLGDDVQ